MPRQITAAGVSIARRPDSIIAALPQTAALADGSALVRRVEVAPLPTPLPAVAAGVRFSSARVDDHARLTEARSFASLGWEPGTVLAARVNAAGRVALSRDTAGASATVSLYPTGSGWAPHVCTVP